MAFIECSRWDIIAEDLTNDNLAVSLDEAKNYLQIYGDETDTLINSMIAAAHQYIGSRTGSFIIPTTIRAFYNPTRFNTTYSYSYLSYDDGRSRYKLPSRHINSPVAVKYYSAADDLVIVTADKYILDETAGPAHITFKSEISINDLSQHRTAPIFVEYQTQLPAYAIKEKHKLAILKITHDLYDPYKRGDQTGMQQFNINRDVSDLIQDISEWRAG